MTTIKKGDIIIPKLKKELIDCAELFDIERMHIPGEIFIHDIDLAW